MTIHHPWDDAPADGGATEIAPGVLWLRLPLPLRLNHVNAFAFRDADGWTVIDTGFDTPPTRAAWEALLAGPMAGAPVTRLILTTTTPTTSALPAGSPRAGPSCGPAGPAG